MVISSVFVFFVGILLAMIPIIELKGAIPIVMSASIWGEYALNPTMAWASAIIGGILASFVAVLVFLPLRRMLEKIKFFKTAFNYCDKEVNKWLTKKTFDIKRTKKHIKENLNETKTTTAPSKTITFEVSNNHSTVKSKKSKQTHDNARLGKFWLVFTFCALPIPFSGVWSSGALCSLLELDFWPSVLSLTSANIICSIVIGVFCSILSEFVDLVLCVFFIIVILTIIYNFTKHLLMKIQIKNDTQKEVRLEEKQN